MQAFTLTKAVLALALCGAVGQAVAQQDVSFTTLARGSYGPSGPPGQHVVTNEQQFRALQLDQVVNAPIDWTSETVVAIFMGAQSSSGYSTEITRITHEQLATILPVPGPPPAYLNTVYYRETTPTGPALTVITTPYHVVKLSTRPGRFVFSNGGSIQPPPPPPPPPPLVGNGPLAFNEVLHEVQAGPRTAKTQLIRDSAQLSQFLADWSGPLAPNVQVDFSTHMLIGIALGRRAAGADVKITAITRNDGSTTPPFPGFPTPMPPYIATVTVNYDVIQNPTIIGGTSFPVQLVEVPRLPGSDQVLFLPNGPSHNQPFNEIRLNTQTFSGSPGGQFPWTTDVEVKANGEVAVLRSHPAAMVAPIYGQATAAELRQLADAVRGARMSSVPDPLLVMIPMHVIAEPFRLTVSSPISDLDGSTGGQLGYYGQWDAQLRPLMSVLDQIRGRLQAEFGTRAFQGRVRISAGEVVIQDGSDRYEVQNADQAKILRRFRGRTVEIRGRATQVNGGSFELDVARIVNPEPFDQGVLTYEENGDVVVFYDGGRRIAEGRLSRLLRGESGNRVTIQGYAFRDAAGDVESVFVGAVRGTATRFSSLRLNGQWAGYVRAGEQAWIQRLSATRRYALVEAPNGTGYLRVDALRIGEPVPLHGGLSGSLGGQ